MSLRRFPWKQPRVTDNSYRLFVATPTPGTPVPDGDSKRHQPKLSTSIPAASEQKRASGEHQITPQIEQKDAGKDEREQGEAAKTRPNEPTDAANGPKDATDEPKDGASESKDTAKEAPKEAPKDGANEQKDVADPEVKHDSSEGQSSEKSAKPDSEKKEESTSNEADKTSEASKPQQKKRSETTTSKEAPPLPPGSAQPQRQEVIKGPWRLLRILPRESRYIIGLMLKVNPRERATLDEIMADEWVKNLPHCSQEVSGKVHNATNHEHVLEPPSSSVPVPSKPK